MATKKTPLKVTPVAVTAKSPVAAATAPALAPKSAPKKTASRTSAPQKAIVASAPATKKATKSTSKNGIAKPAMTLASSVSTTILEDEVRAEAYNYFIQRGYRPGDPVADWHRAEEAVRRRHGLR